MGKTERQPETLEELLMSIDFVAGAAGTDLGRGKIRHFDKDGSPLSFEQFLSKYEDDPQYRRVAYDEITASLSVSTVWLGLEHGRDEKGRPKIFETMIFKDDAECGCRRYATLEDAVAGHKEMVDEAHAMTEH